MDVTTLRKDGPGTAGAVPVMRTGIEHWKERAQIDLFVICHLPFAYPPHSAVPILRQRILRPKPIRLVVLGSWTFLISPTYCRYLASAGLLVVRSLRITK